MLLAGKRRKLVLGAVMVLGVLLLLPPVVLFGSVLLDERARAIYQDGVGDQVLEGIRTRYLSDTRLAAAPDEVARHEPWVELGRYRSGSSPFEGARPAPLAELPGANALTRQIEALLNDSDYDRARQRVEQALADAPDNLQLKYQLSLILQADGDLQQAREVLEALGQAAPGHGPTWIQLAIVLTDMHRWSQDLPEARRRPLMAAALRAMDRAELMSGTGDHLVHLERGIALCFAERFEEAEWDLWKAVEAAPQDGNAYWDIAWVEAQRGDAAATVEAMRFAARDPRLFAMRMCQEAVLCDQYLEPVRDAPAFRAWADRLPRRCVVQDRERGLLEAVKTRLSTLVSRCGS